eukprot:4995652-Pyramimonas_sp.AAC.1
MCDSGHEALRKPYEFSKHHDALNNAEESTKQFAETMKRFELPKLPKRNERDAPTGTSAEDAPTGTSAEVGKLYGLDKDVVLMYGIERMDREDLKQHGNDVRSQAARIVTSVENAPTGTSAKDGKQYGLQKGDALEAVAKLRK